MFLFRGAIVRGRMGALTGTETFFLFRTVGCSAGAASKTTCCPQRSVTFWRASATQPTWSPLLRYAPSYPRVRTCVCCSAVVATLLDPTLGTFPCDPPPATCLLPTRPFRWLKCWLRILVQTGATALKSLTSDRWRPRRSARCVRRRGVEARGLARACTGPCGVRTWCAHEAMPVLVGWRNPSVTPSPPFLLFFLPVRCIVPSLLGRTARGWLSRRSTPAWPRRLTPTSTTCLASSGGRACSQR